jgi:hypothetical protein
MTLAGTIARVAPAYDVPIISTATDRPSPELVAASADDWRVMAAAPAAGGGRAVILQRVSGRGTV